MFVLSVFRTNPVEQVRALNVFIAFHHKTSKYSVLFFDI